MHLRWRKRLREVPKYRVDNAERRLEDGRRVLSRAWRAGIQKWLVERGRAEAEFHWRAEIVHNKNVKGRVVTEHITDLGGITPQPSPNAENGLPSGLVKERLDRLHNRTTPAEHARIEAALSAKVPYTEMPKPSPLTVEQIEASSSRCGGLFTKGSMVCWPSHRCLWARRLEVVQGGIQRPSVWRIALPPRASRSA